jgi:hypothetical protein
MLTIYPFNNAGAETGNEGTTTFPRAHGLEIGSLGVPTNSDYY